MGTDLLEEHVHAEVTAEAAHMRLRALAEAEGKKYYSEDGTVSEIKMGARASIVAAVVIGLLRAYAGANRAGTVLADCGYRIFPNEPVKVRFPDASFIRKEKLPDGKPPDGNLRVVPDLVVEVISPHDEGVEIETKRIAYLRAGVRMIWVIYPDSRTIHVYRQSGPPALLTESDQLIGDDVLPGFTCGVAEVFEGV